MDTWQRIDAAPAPEARSILFAACGCTRWVDGMLARRPFGSSAALLAAAREEWTALDPDDWREAFSHHPQIGDVESLRARFPATHHLSEREQSGVAGAPDEVLAALADANRRYLDRFGYIFIVCASGKTAEEMLTLLRGRIGNAPDVEIGIAAAEQAKITALRLA
jgi:2-oxo-4-hydroxy-4-carboxy-5-ureidoimidazoline decarboxylase